MFSNVREWQAWELDSFHLLYGAAYHCEANGRNAVLTEKLPGTDLRTLLAQGGLTGAAVQAAGRTLRKAHTRYSPYWSAGWSHGDPHLGNVLYDSQQDQAFLIDFETRHEFALGTIERHADDLLTFLLELLGTHNAEHWQRWSLQFLEAYGHTAIILSLRKRLTIPDRFLERVLWRTRTNHLPTHELKKRLALLNRLTESLC